MAKHINPSSLTSTANSEDVSFGGKIEFPSTNGKWRLTNSSDRLVFIWYDN
jgi:hypothetical protein